MISLTPSLPPPRVVRPELLDKLADRDPVALRSRNDIQLLNRLMGHRGALLRLLRGVSWPTPPRYLVEIGGGDGRFLLRLAQQLALHWPGVNAMVVDCKNVVTNETACGFKQLGWRLEVVTQDVFAWLRQVRPDSLDVTLANLFLHQFAEPELAELLRLAAERTRVLAACEPRRSRFALAGSRFLGLIGCNAVTRHDGLVSVQAGFAGHELSRLWPAGERWRLHENSSGLFSHAFLADRNGRFP